MFSDGLNVDGQNRIWFDEEFANKLAEANQSGVPLQQLLEHHIRCVSA
jgi:hypothetical protein